MTCPNCGQESEGERCPKCGHPTHSTGGRIAAILVVVFLVLPLGLFGACSALGVVSAGSDPGGLAMFVLLAAFGFGTALLTMRWANRLWKGE